MNVLLLTIVLFLCSVLCRVAVIIHYHKADRLKNRLTFLLVSATMVA
jgi:cell division protein FtsL